jgi:hypothetical protein
VSPDAGVPEHQPDKSRQTGRPRTSGQPRQTPNGPPQNGGRPQPGQFPSGQTPTGRTQPSQFESGQFPSGQVPAAGQQQSGPFQSGPFQSGQFQSGQFQSGQFQSGQIQSGQIQSGQYQSGQFQSGRVPSGQVRPGQVQSGQVPAAGQPQSGQFRGNPPQSGQFPTRSTTRSSPTPTAPGPGRLSANPAGDGGADGGGRRKRAGRRDWIWSVVAFLVAAGVIAAVGFHFFGPDAGEEPTAAWAVDSCAGSDPTAQDTGAASDTYRPLSCDDPEATVTVLDIQDAVSVGQMHCPAGTDVVFQKDGQAGGDTQAVCARNLSDDHPGDPGMGGGQLVTGDCVNGDGGEVACSAGGARKVTGLMVGGSECPEGTVDQLALGFDAQRSYETICLGD